MTTGARNMTGLIVSGSGYTHRTHTCIFMNGE